MIDDRSVDVAPKYGSMSGQYEICRPIIRITGKMELFCTLLRNFVSIIRPYSVSIIIGEDNPADRLGKPLV